MVCNLKSTNMLVNNAVNFVSSLVSAFTKTTILSLKAITFGLSRIC